LPAILSDVTDALTRAVRRRFGESATIDNVEQATLGGSNRTLLFDVVEGEARRRLVSREETFGGEANPFLSPDAQYRLLSIVHAAGVATPEPVFAFDADDELGPGFVSAFSPGKTLPRRLLADDTHHKAILNALMDVLVRLQALDTTKFGFLVEYPESGDPIAAMRMRIDALDEPHPALELGLRWLERHPTPVRPKCLVHGDFRMGNFMIDGPKVTALLDWECSHLGAHAEDLGWLCTRSWRFGRLGLHAGGLATRAEMLDVYAAHGGPRMDEDEVRWWEIHGLVRWGMYNVLQAHGHMLGRKSPAYAVCGRNAAMMEYDLLMTLNGSYD
jgi:aminoglycoside phosphotransferase (APT) family kinase protein